MDWIGSSFCQDFANNSSITDIVDLVENSGIYETSDEGNARVEPVVSSFDNGGISGTGNQGTNSVAPATCEEPAYPVADTTADLNYYYDGKKREQKRRPKPKDGSSLVCVICGDRALGYNFDAITCESCKAFFRRNALKAKVFTCSFDGNCKLDPHTRKFCSGCRLKKCFEAGMKKNWILSDDQLAKRRKRGSSGSIGDQPIHKQYNPLPTPNGEIERPYIPPAPVSGGSFSDSQESSSMDSGLTQIPNPVKLESFSPQISCEEVTSNYLSDDTDTSSVFANTSPPLVKMERDEEDFSRPLTEEISSNIANLEKEYKVVFDVGYSEEQARKFTEKPHNANELFNMTDIFIRRLIKFAKHIPEFRQLKQEDQILLLKGGIMEIMVLRSAMGFDMSQHQWKLQDATQAREHSMDPKIIQEQLGQSMYKEHVKFVTSLHQLTRSDRTIMTLLFVIELFSPDRGIMSNKENIALAQEKFSLWLRCYLESIMSVSEAKTLYPKLLVKLLDVRNLGESSAKLASHLDIKKLEPLLIEVFNLQK